MNEITVDMSSWEKLKDPKEIQELVRSKFSNVKQYGFLPAGDLDAGLAGIINASEWNKSMTDLFDLHMNPSKILGRKINFSEIFGADAKGTEKNKYLDPVPYINKINRTYLQSRTDPMNMNVRHMDYTNDPEMLHLKQGMLEFAKYCDINGDGLIGADDAALIMRMIDINSNKDGKNVEIERILVNVDDENPKHTLDEIISKMNYSPLSLRETGKFLYPDRTQYIYNIYEPDVWRLYLCIEVNQDGEDGLLTLFTNPNGIYGDKDTDSLTILTKFLQLCSLEDGEGSLNRKAKELGVDFSFNLELALHILACISSSSKGVNAYVDYETFAYYLSNVASNHCIRLLMPQYARRVEVEDLNKNFWVIGQVLDTMATALFGKNGLFKINQTMANEIGELWQNTSYIWNLIVALNDNTNKLKNLLGIGNVTAVSWGIDGVREPKLSIVDNPRLDQFELIFDNQFGTRTVGQIFNTQVTGKIKSGSTIIEPQFDSEGKYDIKQTAINLNKFTTKNPDNKVHLRYLTVNTDGTKTQAQFDTSRDTDNVNDGSLAQYLYANPNDYFRLIKNFSIVIYDKDYYIYEENEGTGRLRYSDLIEEDKSNSSILPSRITDEEPIFNGEYDSKSDEIVFYLASSKYYDGEIVRIDFVDFHLQNNIPKADCKVNDDGTIIDSPNPKDSYWDSGKYYFWKTSFFKKAENSEYELNNKIFIKYRNKNLSENLIHNQVVNVTLFRTDLIDSYDEDDIYVMSKNNLENYPFYAVNKEQFYEAYQNGNGGFCFYGGPGYKGNASKYRNLAKEFVYGVPNGTASMPNSIKSSDLSQAGSINFVSVFEDKFVVSNGDSKELKSSIADNIINSPDSILNSFIAYSNNITSQDNSVYYPATYIKINPYGFPFTYNMQLSFARFITENMSFDVANNQWNKIRLIGKPDNEKNYSDCYTEGNHFKELLPSDIKTISNVKFDGKRAYCTETNKDFYSEGQGSFIFDGNNFDFKHLLILIETTLGKLNANNTKHEYHYNYPRIAVPEFYGQAEPPTVHRRTNFSE